MSNWTKIGRFKKSKEELNVISWHIFLSCRVSCTVKRLIWMSMWPPFECALWRKFCFTRLSLIILLLICFVVSTIRAALCNLGNLNVTLWHVFLSCRVLCTIKRILWMSMWLFFKCALLKRKVLFHSFVTNYFVIDLFFFPRSGQHHAILETCFCIVFWSSNLECSKPCASSFLNLKVKCL